MNIIITGAASGIGAAAAKYFIERGHRVYGIDRNMAEGFEGEAFFTADVTVNDSLTAVADSLTSMNVKLDAIVSVAGVHGMYSLAEDRIEDIERLMDINLLGVMRVCRALHPLLSPRGRIVIVTSEVATYAPLPFNGLYSVSKAALESYAQALRQELNLLGQSVVTVRPGAVATPLSAGSVGATEGLAERTALYKGQAGKFANLTRKFMGKPITPDKMALTVYRATVARHPRLAYARHRNPGLVMLSLLPRRMQCGIIRLLLGVDRSTDRE